MSQATTPSSCERHLRRRRRLLLALAGGAVLLAVGPVAVIGYQLIAARQELAAAVAETDRQDPAWRFEDLEAQRHLPPAAQNAALQVLTVHSSLPPRWFSPPASAQDEDSGSVDPVLYNLSPERQLDQRQLRRVSEDVERAEPALDQARKLADMPEGRYPVTWTPDIISTSDSWIAAILDTRTLLQLDALLRSQHDDPDAALTSARALLNVGRSLGDEPFFSGPAVRNGCRREAARAVERILAQGQPSEQALAAVQQSLAREDASSLLLAHFRGERAMMHIFLTRVDEGRNRISEASCVPTQGFSARAETCFGRLGALHKHAQYLRDMNEAVEIAKLRLEEQYPYYREWRRQNGAVENVGDGLWSGPEEGYILTTHALLRCTLVALAAERYRLEHGDWPLALTDLVPAYLPAVPLDPFDGKPLRYRRTADGVVIYSIGEDGQDDGGDPSRPAPALWPRDVVFTLWDVARRRQPPVPPSADEGKAQDR